MSSFERAYCCSTVWRFSSSAIARELGAQRLGHAVLEIGAGSGSVAQQLLSTNPKLIWTAVDMDPLMVHSAATRLREFPNASAKTADASARTPLVSLIHRLDGSPHRPIVPDHFRAECARNGLTISLRSRLLGHAMQFVANKKSEEISCHR
jgi:protein-L-isoaspartate O-methyltransferase